MKVAFITNFHLYRVGFNLRLHRHIRTLKDPDPKEWKLPLTYKELALGDRYYKNKCIGKAVSDSVEAMIGALFLTASNPMIEKKTKQTGLYRAFKWLSDIKCVPLRTSGILDRVKQYELSTLDLNYPLYKFGYT